MDLQLTKLELIEMLLKTEKKSVLKKIETLLLEEMDMAIIDYEMIETRRQSHLNEESASYSWEEVKKKVRAANL